MKNKVINQVFVERANKLKIEDKMTLDAIEEKINISKGSLSKYMNGLHLPNSEVVKSLAKHWGVSLDYLLGSSDERTNEFVDGRDIPIGYVNIIKDAIEHGVSEEEFRGLLDMAIKLKSGR
ncbi:MAG: helix-turn-helix transcriptional regulator [Phycisphaerae bacterium]|nr:helix-turn-helix transcriptional regulator [Phycisphaerae bacterium]